MTRLGATICLAGTLATALVACAAVQGPKGNDTGGIIPWSADTERGAMAIAQGNCGGYNKHAVITSVNRQYGGYIAYACRFDPPRSRRR